MISPDMPASEGESLAEEPQIVTPVPTPKTMPIAPPPEQPKTYNAVTLRGLNKVTARISDMTAPLGAVMHFGSLEIIAKRCWQAPPEEQPENAALLEIRELKPGEGPVGIFSGWMFSSSPGLSGLEHAVYDVTVLNCAMVENQ